MQYVIIAFNDDKLITKIENAKYKSYVIHLFICDI